MAAIVKAHLDRREETITSVCRSIGIGVIHRERIERWKEKRTLAHCPSGLFQRCKQQRCAGRRECNGPPGLSNRFRRARSYSFMVYLALCRWERKILGALCPLQTSARTISTGVPLNWIKRRARFCTTHPGNVAHALPIRRRVNLSYSRRFRRDYIAASPNVLARSAPKIRNARQPRFAFYIFKHRGGVFFFK